MKHLLGLLVTTFALCSTTASASPGLLLREDASGQLLRQRSIGAATETVAINDLFAAFDDGRSGLLLRTGAPGLLLLQDGSLQHFLEDRFIASARWNHRGDRILVTAYHNNSAELYLLEPFGELELLHTGAIVTASARISADDRYVSWIQEDGPEAGPEAGHEDGQELIHTRALVFDRVLDRVIYASSEPALTGDWFNGHLVISEPFALLQVDPSTGEEALLASTPFAFTKQLAAGTDRVAVLGTTPEQPELEQLIVVYPTIQKEQAIASGSSLYLRGIDPGTGSVAFETLSPRHELWIQAFARNQRVDVLAALPYADFPWTWNEKRKISQGYNGGSHTGTDVYALDWNLDGTADNGKPVLAVEYGQVVAMANSNSTSGYGTYVKLSHPCSGAVCETLVGHGIYNSIGVVSNQVVSQGTFLMQTGTTGYSSGPHIHQRFHYNGAATKPEPMCGKSGFATNQEHTSCQKDFTWKFSYSGQAEGWRGVNGTLSVGSDLLYFNPSTSDPQVLSPTLKISGSQVSTLKMRIRGPSTYGTKGAQIFFSAANCTPSDARSYKFNITYNNNFNEVTVPLNKMPSWTSCGTINYVRLDPVPAGLSSGDDTISFDWINFY